MAVMLYNDPHPVHRQMADAIAAELVPAEQGGVIDRVRSALSHRFDEPVILEGGVPLLEGALLRVLRRVRGPVLLLAADETQHDIHRPLPYYSWPERVLHRLSHEFIDGVIAVSENVAADAEALVDGPVEVAHPFVLDDRAEALGDLSPPLDSHRVLCVGEYRLANNQDLLVRAAERALSDIHIDLVGKGTTNAPGGEHVTRHGYVSEARLVELYEQAALCCQPALAGAFPVATLEAMHAGVPVLVSDRIGTAAVVDRVNPQLVVHPEIAALSIRLDWYFDQPVGHRQRWGERGRALATAYNEADGRRRFSEAYESVVSSI